MAVEQLRQHSVVRSVLAFLPELRPAWWVLRAWLALLALDYLFGTRSFVFRSRPRSGWARSSGCR